VITLELNSFYRFLQIGQRNVWFKPDRTFIFSSLSLTKPISRIISFKDSSSLSATFNFREVIYLVLNQREPQLKVPVSGNSKRIRKEINVS
jgi:hypothetical protein